MSYDIDFEQYYPKPLKHMGEAHINCLRHSREFTVLRMNIYNHDGSLFMQLAKTSFLISY